MAVWMDVINTANKSTEQQ